MRFVIGKLNKKVITDGDYALVPYYCDDEVSPKFPSQSSEI
jgi:hypothetical protein